jgi:hypothetical protein
VRRTVHRRMRWTALGLACVVRRIGGRKSHPEFHRVQSDDKLLATYNNLGKRAKIAIIRGGLQRSVESDQDLQALFVHRSNGHIQSVSEA